MYRNFAVWDWVSWNKIPRPLSNCCNTDVTAQSEASVHNKKHNSEVGWDKRESFFQIFFTFFKHFNGLVQLIYFPNIWGFFAPFKYSCKIAWVLAAFLKKKRLSVFIAPFKYSCEIAWVLAAFFLMVGRNQPFKEKFVVDEQFQAIKR